MFGNMSQIASLLRNAGQIKQNMQEMQERLKTARHEGEAGAGQVRATVDGRGELVALRIDPQLVAGGDVEMIEDLVVAAVRDAVARSREALQQEMRTATGGMDLSGMMGDMLGGK
ncbi:MAG: YbaB/EbfC family nucleoid-associated protein [Planctomycetota bacterium]|nr:MAG: YbaB/EbfC family nucleoid-associated protein [Planctomycetota bacterium]